MLRRSGLILTFIQCPGSPGSSRTKGDTVWYNGLPLLLPDARLYDIQCTSPPLLLPIQAFIHF